MPQAPARPATKWSDDAFLNALRDQSDPLADACARDLPRDQSLAFMFTKMRTDAALPSELELPDAFRTFLNAARPSLELDDLTDAELAKLRKGQQVFLTNALPAALILLSKSLQEGYQAPRLSKVLMMSGALDSQTYRRVLGVLQMLLKVVAPGSFDPKLTSTVLPSSDAGLEAIKVRLMHAGLRGIAKAKYTDFTRQHGGEPISLEDLLATLMAFSALVMDGFDTLKISLSAEDAEAYHFIWRVYARTMGIHPPGQPKSWDYVPQTLADAHEFYDAYKRRYYATADLNPAGVDLANANLKMLARRMPPLAARIYMHKLIGDRASRELGIEPVPLMFVWKVLLLNFPRAWIWSWRILDRSKGGVARHEELTQWLLQKLIVVQYNAGIPSYRVPRDLNEIKDVVRGTQPGLNVGSDQFKREVFPVELDDIVKRREAVGVDAAALRAKGPPDSGKGLVGLALSGGGIRSATFALGAVQALARRGSLKMVDYLSTVSGGGYTGGALSSLLNDPDAGLDGRAFPLNFETGAVEPPALRHLRSGANYLTGGGAMDAARLPAILLRGLLLNMVLILPYIMLAAAATFWLFPLVHESDTIRFTFWLALGLLLAVIVTYPTVTWLYGRGRTWDQRNRAENILTLSLVIFVTTVCVSMLSGPVTNAIMSNWMHAKAFLLGELASPVDGEDLWKWAVIGAVLYGAIRATKVAESMKARSNRLVLYALGLTAPVAAFGIYLMLLVVFARSPYLDVKYADVLTRAAHAKRPVITDTTLLRDLRANGLQVTPTSRVTVDAVQGGRRTPVRWTIRAGAAHAYVIADVNGTLKMDGVGFGRGTARLARLAGAAGSIDSVAKDDSLELTLRRLAASPDSVLEDTTLIQELRALGVAGDSGSTVVQDRDSSWTLSPRRGGDAYRISRTDRGMIFANADLGTVAALGSLLPNAKQPVDTKPSEQLRAAMHSRGASLDSAVTADFIPAGNYWIVRSSTATEYTIALHRGTVGAESGGGSGLPKWVHRIQQYWNPNGVSPAYLYVEGIAFGSSPRDLWFFGVTVVLLFLNLLVMDVNITSPHGYWRDRLSRVFLFRARWFGRPVPNDGLKLSELGTLNPAVPYHLLNTSLNLTASRVEDMPGRGSDFFMFSRRYVGSYSTGYCTTEAIEASDRHLNLGTAMAISSAAVAPNAGTVTVKPLVPMLTVLNVRQDYWAPNPWFVQASSLVQRARARVLGPGPLYLFREALGLLHARGPFVNLSDGGHIENLAVYELLRRRCKVIVAADAERDPTISCASLAKLIRYARIDLGIEIEINLDPFALDETGLTERHWTLGTIHYGTSRTGEPETGYLLYVKSSVTGDEAPYVKDYRRANPAFPHESTADQFFDEAQFESYRALGYHAINGALECASTLDVGNGTHGSPEALTAVRDALGLMVAHPRGDGA